MERVIGSIPIVSTKLRSFSTMASTIPWYGLDEGSIPSMSTKFQQWRLRG